MITKRVKVLCVDNCAELSSEEPLLKEGEEYFVDGERANPENPSDIAYTIEGINETCSCCGERLCFPQEAFIPLN